MEMMAMVEDKLALQAWASKRGELTLVYVSQKMRISSKEWLKKEGRVVPLCTVTFNWKKMKKNKENEDMWKTSFFSIKTKLFFFKKSNKSIIRTYLKLNIKREGKPLFGIIFQVSFFEWAFSFFFNELLEKLANINFFHFGKLFIIVLHGNLV